jgi:hypothetical protein
VLQSAGAWYVSSVIAGAAGTYGTFALVIGLLSWFWVGAHVLLAGAETNVVRRERLWPRSLTERPFHDDDPQSPGSDDAWHVRSPDSRISVEKEESMTQDPLEEMGPVDYVVLEWPGRQPKGDVAPMILELADRGIIRILDVALMVKGNDGSVAAIDLGEVNGDGAGFDAFTGASTGLLGQQDLEEAAAALAPGTSAAVLVWENRWAAPVAVAVRKSGGQLVASGRIEIQAILAALDALEENSAVTN